MARITEEGGSAYRLREECQDFLACLGAGFLLLLPCPPAFLANPALVQSPARQEREALLLELMHPSQCMPSCT